MARLELFEVLGKLFLEEAFLFDLVKGPVEHVLVDLVKEVLLEDHKVDFGSHLASCFVAVAIQGCWLDLAFLLSFL